jgi:hypothetical protein
LLGGTAAGLVIVEAAAAGLVIVEATAVGLVMVEAAAAGLVVVEATAVGLVMVEASPIGINNWFLENKSMFAIRVFLDVGGATSDLLALLVSIDGKVLEK